MCSSAHRRWSVWRDFNLTQRPMNETMKTLQTMKNTKLPFKVTTKFIRFIRNSGFWALLGLASLSNAQTFVSGNISGTWSLSGSPFIVTANCTVPSGQALTIQPGVTVTIGQGLSIIANGTISAIGTAAQPIIFKGASPSLYWSEVGINYSGAPSTFQNCHFSDGTNELFFYIAGGNAAMTASILNCVFTNAPGSCIYGNAVGLYFYNGSYGEFNASLSPLIANCLFSGSTNGCNFYSVGSEWDGFVGYGSVNPQIVNCDFSNITGSAINFTGGNYTSYSTPTVQNNLFVQCGNAVQQTSTTLFGDTPAYNCFFNNTVNFVGYTSVFGTICCQNARGTNCDISYNIFQNPLFAETVTYTIASNSPCIDAGNPAGAYLDTKFPPSQGTTVNDIGLTGGPYAGNALTNSYNGTTNFILTVAQYIGVTINPSGAGQYRLDGASNLNGPWTQVTNLALLSTPWTWIDYGSLTNSRRFYRAVLLP